MTLYKTEVGKPVTFADESTEVNSTATYTWDFGDGSSETGSVVTHTYTTKSPVGIPYTITHSVKNSCNALPSQCSTHQIEIVDEGTIKGTNPIAYLGLGYVLLSLISKK